MASVDIHRFATEASRAADERQKAEERSTAWGFLWVLFVFKMVTVGIIFWAAEGSGEAGALLTATTFPWLIIPVLAIAGPLAYWYRLRRVRARRAHLLRAEWMVGETDGGE
ncbi:MAG TPA: hypothetical protein VH482_32500 [Thermomicrobiales bacterium]|jgi:hypothetical protein